MNKEEVVSAISGLIESYKRWEELNFHLASICGEGLCDTRYSELIEFHEELVYDLIQKNNLYRDCIDSDANLAEFCDCLYYLATDKVYRTQVFDETGPTGEIYDVRTAEDVYNYFISPVDIIIPSMEELNCE